MHSSLVKRTPHHSKTLVGSARMQFVRHYSLEPARALRPRQREDDREVGCDRRRYLAGPDHRQPGRIHPVLYFDRPVLAYPFQQRAVASRR